MAGFNKLELDGADTAFDHVIKSISIEKMRIGLRVKAIYAEVSTSTIMDIDHFVPAI